MPTFTAAVDVDLEDVLEDYSEAEALATFERHFSTRAPAKGSSVPVGFGTGDPPPDRYIDAAYLAAKAMPDCPRPIADLFWHVHGRAL